MGSYGDRGWFQLGRLRRVSRRDLAPGRAEYRMTVSPRPTRAVEVAFSETHSAVGMRIHIGELVIEGTDREISEISYRADRAIDWLLIHHRADSP